MIGPLWQLASVLATTFVAPFVAAHTPLALPLPQNFNITQYITGQLTQNILATDPRHATVAAAKDDGEKEDDVAKGPQLQTFITNNQSCVRIGEDLSYRVVVRNISNITAREVTVQFQYPQTTTFRDSDPKPDKAELPETRLIEWRAPELIPGATAPYSIILNVQQAIETTTVNVTVFYTDENGTPFQTLTSHTIDGPCADTAAPAASPVPPDQAKKPAIVCEPADTTCNPTYADLPLGINYQRVLQAPNNRTPLGKRFAEAYADIVPGECRVTADDIITSPEFHDALNRRAKPAAFYLRPLYDSGQEYRAMIIENILEAIPHFGRVHQKLRDAHADNWRDLTTLINDVLEDQTTTASALARYDQLVPQWEERIRALHDGFFQDYRATQEKKKIKFDTVAYQAVINSGTSQCRACGPPCGPDQGLEQKLVTVKETYLQSLDEREAAYPQTQTESLQRYSQYLVNVRTQFQPVLEQYAQAQAAAQQSPDDKELARQATNASAALRQFPRTVPNLSPNAETEALQLPYDTHDQTDEQRDENIRLSQWETALDTPKQVATACEKENIFPPKVETTWCESGASPELIIQDAPEPAKAKAGAVRPPAPIPGGQQAIINPAAVRGDVCGEGPGDPYWTLSCKCHCGQLVICGSKLVRCEDLYTCTFDPLDRIERHDIHVNSQLECLWDGAKHEDPFF